MASRIGKVGVLGAGVMGSQIACLLADAGCEVLLLDLKKEGRNLAEVGLERALKLKPSPLRDRRSLARIVTGNFEDDWGRLADCEWIIEVVVEDPQIKKNLLAGLAGVVSSSAIITTNTSSIPIGMLAEALPGELSSRFFGTHFFNPPRYLPLLEVIPWKGTDEGVVARFVDFAGRWLGKMCVPCKDTPAFIANRIGVYGIVLTLKLMEKHGLAVGEVDSLTGELIGRPRSATFRTADIVGIDTLVRVADFLAGALPQERENFSVPEWVRSLVEQGALGEKSGQGFYRREEKEGRRIIYEWDWQKGEYRERRKYSSAAVERIRNVDDLDERVRRIVFEGDGGDRGVAFLRELLLRTLEYVLRVTPQVAEHFWAVDHALEAGFGWQKGPYRLIDAVGGGRLFEVMEREGMEVPAWAWEVVKRAGSFYQIDRETLEVRYWDGRTGSYRAVEPLRGVVVPSLIPRHVRLWGNNGVSLFDIGDGVLLLTIHTKMNTLGSEVIEGINRAIDLAEKEERTGLIITSVGDNFSAGANLALIYMMASAGEWDELELAVRTFQQTMQRVKFCEVPVVAVSFGLTLGGGCELCLHADAVVSDVELYMGLVETGVGLIPAGGGTKEMVIRASDSFYEGDTQIANLQRWFLPVAQAKVSTSAEEAYEMGLLLRSRATSLAGRHRLVSYARKLLLLMREAGYTPPQKRTDITVLGKPALATLKMGAYLYRKAGWITEYEEYVAGKLAYVFCGGELSGTCQVSEDYLLELEREVFLHLAGQPKTLERVQAVLTTGRPVRN